MHFNICRIGWIAQCGHKIGAKYSALQKYGTMRNLMFSVILCTNLIAALPGSYLLLPMRCHRIILRQFSSNVIVLSFTVSWYRLLRDVKLVLWGFLLFSVIPLFMFMGKFFWQHPQDIYKFNFSSLRIIFVLYFIRKEHTDIILAGNCWFCLGLLCFFGVFVLVVGFFNLSWHGACARGNASPCAVTDILYQGDFLGRYFVRRKLLSNCYFGDKGL